MGFARIIILLAVALGLSGCVTKENYNREVLRATNFQRLLSEQERQSAELNAEIAKLKEQVASLETKTKALTAQLNDAKAQVVRSLEEVGRLQDDLSEARATATALNAVRSAVPKGPAAKPKGQTGVTPAPPVSSSEPPDRLGELRGGAVGKKNGKTAAPAPVAAEDSSFFYHDVKKGETLKSIAKQYKTDVKTLRELNDLASNEEVEAGGHIIVGQKP
jgi:LysM repeat protein